MIRGRNAMVRRLMFGISLLLLAVLTACGGGGSSSGGGNNNPPPTPSLASVAPGTGNQGDTLTVTVTGVNTNFAAGATTANFGAGISVGNAAVGADGPVTVVSKTSFTAQLKIDAAATLGPRMLIVKTGSETVQMANQFTVNPIPNHPPVANPGGPYSALLGTVVNFNGSGSSDPDNDTITYDWNFGDNTTHGTGATPSHTYATGGTYTVTLIVTDSKNATNSKTTTASIDTPPIANIGGPYTGVPGTAIAFNGSASSDADNDTLTFDWNFGDGSTHGSGATPSHTYAAGGNFTVTLVVSDGRGGSDSKTTTFLVDHLPVANLGGPYSIQVGTPVSLNGSASSDADNDPLTFDWDFGDGTAHGSGATPSHTYTAGGSFTISLTVTDGKGGSDTKTLVVTPNRAPVANPGGPYALVLGAPLNLNGSASSDPDNDTLTFDWDFGDGTAHGSGATPSHTYVAGGTFTISLTVTDGKGGSATQTTTASVDRMPVANLGGPYSIQVNQAVNFNGVLSADPDNDPLTFDWDFGDGTPHGTGPTPSHTYATAGPFTLTLVVSDGRGGTDTKTLSVSPNRPPVANTGGPYTLVLGAPLNFTGSATDPDGDTLTYDWDFGDGSAHGSGATPSHTYAAGGTFQVTLVVTDGKGGSDTKTTAASVDRAPVANAGGPYTAQINQPVTLSGSATDADNDPLTYDWDFGDNTAHGNVPNPTHTYSVGGPLTITLTVTDGKGGSDTKTASIAVNRPPVANAGGPYTGASGVALLFNASATDPDGDTLTYAWDFGDLSQGSGAAPSHTYANGGSYTATLTVTDGKGGSDTKLVGITISGATTNHNPVAHLTGPTGGASNTSLAFDASTSTDPDNDALTYLWDFGDGSVGSGAQVTHTYLIDGSYTVKVTVSDGKGGQDTASQGVNIKSDFTPPIVSITGPTPLTLFNQGTTTVTGTVSDPDDTNGLTVKVNGVDAIVTNGQFTASNVPLREGNNTLTAVASDPVGNVATYSIAVTLDTTPPTITFTSPSASAVLMANTVDASGNVNDAVPGTVNSGDVTVKVNGFDAQISNRSFIVQGLSLVPGMNTLTAVATDKAGNTSQAQIQVNLSTLESQQHIQILSGSGQTGVIGAMLTDPLIVQLVDSNGVGIADRQITFTVAKSDGMLSVLGQQDQTVNVQSDQDGKASVLFQLGTRVGVGINQVKVTSPGATGEVVFTETSTAGAPAAINIVGGTNQSGPVGQPLPLPFAVIVYDAGGNPLSGVPVAFTVASGGGNFGGNPTITVNTDTDGKANTLLTLGQQEGINNNVVMANYQGNQAAGVSFLATGIAPGNPAATTISGVTLDNAATPVPNVTVTIVGTALQAVTDDQGRFTISNAPVGTVSLLVDGRTSTRSETFPFLNFQLTTIAGHDNTIGGPIYLPEIDTDSSKIVGGDQDIVLTMKDVPGYQFTIFAHSAKFPDGSTTGRMSLSQVHSDKVPMIPPNGSAPKYAGTLQPPGVIFNPPIKVQFPNTDGLAPGTVIDVYTYDHDLEQWVSQGPARVSSDGAVIVSDAGFGITKSGWHFAPPPPPPKSCTASCKGDDCNSSTLQDPPCTCVTQPTNEGGSCGGQPMGCQDQGICVSGICTGQYKQSGTSCDDGQFCTQNDKCFVLNECKGEPIPDQNGPSEQVSFGFLNNIVQGIRTWKQLIPIGPDIPDASLAGSHQVIHTCCEDKKAIVDNDQYQLQATFPAFSTGDLTIQAPPWSGDYTVKVLGKEIGVAYGAHGNLQVALTAALSRTKDACKDNTCWGGSVGVQATLTGGLKGEVPNPALNPTCGDLHNEVCDIVKIFADFQTGLQFTGGVDCQKISANFDWSGLTLNLGVVVLDGTSFNFSFTKTFVLFQPQHILTTEVALPQ